MEQHRRSLATAHAMLMFLALVALASLASAWRGPDSAVAWLDTPAICLQTAALMYLASTAMLEWNIAHALRGGRSVQVVLGLPTMLGHLWVLLVSAATAWRGAASRTLLAGLDWQLATLLTASLLALALLFPTLRLPGQAPDAAQQRQLRGLSWLHAAICLAVVFALWHMEAQTLRSSPPVSIGN